jgi:hypothetical protein
MDDRDTLPLNFDEWEKNAESERAAAKREGGGNPTGSVDNKACVATGAPEPNSLMLLGTALVGLGFLSFFGQRRKSV